MSRRAGFTLIELVVVIMILGILAAVAAPKFLGTSGTAKDNGIKQTLSIVRDAIEMYTAKNGVVPVCDASPNTNFKLLLTPYLRGTFPTSPVGTMDNNISPVTGATTTATGTTTSWMYNNTTGEFICNCTTNSSFGTAYSTF